MYYIAGFIRMCGDVKNNSSQKGKPNNTLQGLTLVCFFPVIYQFLKIRYLLGWIATRLLYQIIGLL